MNAPQRQQGGVPLRPDWGAMQDRHITSLVRACLGTALAIRAQSSGRGPATATSIVERTWPDDHGAALLTRAAVSPTSTTNATALAQTAQFFMSALAGPSAGAALLERGLQLSFGSASSITLPTLAPGLCGFVGESSPIPVKQFVSTAGPTMVPHKLAAIVELTNEMMRSANAEAMVRAVLVESAALGLDQILFDANAGDAIRPPGLRYNVAPITAASGGGLAHDLMVEDAVKLGTAVMKAGGTALTFVAAVPQAIALNLRSMREFSYAVLPSAALADGMVIAVGTNALAVALDPVAVDSASQVSVVESDPSAGEVVDIGGVVGRPLRSTFQTDSVALRLRLPVTWALRASGAVAWTQSVGW